jgi:putative membrane protein
MGWLYNWLLGLVIGIASITPGLSGGALMAALGLYQPVISAVSRLFADWRRNLRFLLPLGLGAVTGVVAFSNLMAWLIHQYPGQVRWLFLGLVAGSLPALIRTANTQGWNWRLPLFSLITMAALPAASLLGDLLPGISLSAAPDLLQYILFGLVIALGTIVPGISSSFLLMSLGAYDDLLQALAELNLAALLPLGIGFGAGGLLLVRLVENLFRRFHAQSYYSVLGFLLGSALLILPPLRDIGGILVDASLVVLGILLTQALLRLKPGD